MLAQGVDHFLDQHFGRRGAGGQAKGRRLAQPVPVDVAAALDQPRRDPEALGRLDQAQRIAAVGAPMFSIRSHCGAIALTAAWRLVVA